MEVCEANACIALHCFLGKGAIHNIFWTLITTDKVSAGHMLCAVQSRMTEYEGLGLALLFLRSFLGIYSCDILSVGTERTSCKDSSHLEQSKRHEPQNLQIFSRALNEHAIA